MAYKKGSSKPLSNEDKNSLIEKYKEEVDDYTLNIASKILDLVENQDKVPLWEHPVFNKFYMNPESGTKFNMENSILLYWIMKQEEYKHPLFLTAKQGFENGMSMEKGTTGHYIVQRFGMKMHPLFELDANGKPIQGVDGKNKLKRNEEGEIQFLYKRCAKLTKVFNIAQFTGPIPAKWEKYMKENEEKLSNEEDIKKLKEVVLKSVEPTVYRHVSADNYYLPYADAIYLSESSMFRDSLSELSVIFHEWSHSTGHPKRLNRESLNRYSEDNSFRGYEELVANFSARRLCNFYNLDNNELVKSFNDNHDSYDAGWANRAIMKGPDQLFKAAADADRAFNKIRMSIEPNLKLDNSLKSFLTNKIEGEESENEEKPTIEKTQKKSWKRSL